MAVQEQKLRLLYLLQILLERTDEDHILNASELIQILEKERGITADRKTIYHEIDILLRFGFDIEKKKGRNPGYYIANRFFELAELKLLVDAVQCSNFITDKKTEDLIRKLERLTSQHNAEQLNMQLCLQDWPKTENETIYYSVDRIHTAIYNDLQVTFQYAEWTAEKEFKLKKDGALYQVSPWALRWDNQRYYLIAYDAKADLIKHYRVDKMQHLTVAKEKRLGQDAFEGFALPAFAKKTFGMYSGQDENIDLICTNAMAGILLDRFGQDIPIMPLDEDHFYAKVEVAVSVQFFGWLTGVGKDIRIVSPEHVKNEYKSYLSDILNAYAEDEQDLSLQKESLSCRIQENTK